MRTILILAAVLLMAAPAAAQFSINPNVGASFITKDGETARVGEILADVGYQFPWGTSDTPRWWGELCLLYGLGENGNQVGGLGMRAYMQQGSVFPGFGLQTFVVDAGVADQVEKTSITIAPEILLEIPWTEESQLHDGTRVVNESRVTGYAALYFPVSGDKDFTMVRFGVRTSI